VLVQIVHYETAAGDHLQAIGADQLQCAVHQFRGDAAAAAQWAADLGAIYAPTRMIFAIPDGVELPGALAAKSAGPSTVAYLCTGMTCSAPMTDFSEVWRALTLRVG